MILREKQPTRELATSIYTKVHNSSFLFMVVSYVDGKIGDTAQLMWRLRTQRQRKSFTQRLNNPPHVNSSMSIVNSLCQISQFTRLVTRQRYADENSILKPSGVLAGGSPYP